MRITIMGSGYVGLVTGACLADSGNHVLGLDIDAAKVARLKQGECPIFEPGLAEMLERNLRAGRLTFTTDGQQAADFGDVTFVAIGTPPRDDGSPDLCNIEQACDALAAAMTAPKIVVVKSTVPVGTGARLEARMREKTEHAVDFVSNPEFLKEGTAVDDFLRPDRVVVGAEDEAAGQIVADLYEPFVRNQHPILHMSRAAAEMTKYAANSYLAMRISFINEVANLCERYGIDVDEVRRGIGTDARIGSHFLFPGAGYGGSCFPKDVQALAHSAAAVGCRAGILEAVHDRNQQQRRLVFDKLAARLGPDLTGKRIAVWGIAFKPKTDDIREAPAVVVIRLLLDAGARVVAYDPEALHNLRAEFGDKLDYAADAYEALKDADALAIMTEWNEFRSPDFARMRDALATPLVVDGRNLYRPAQMQRHGFEYHSIGRPPVTPT